MRKLLLTTFSIVTIVASIYFLQDKGTNKEIKLIEVSSYLHIKFT
jgi:hypothetical protein